MARTDGGEGRTRAVSVRPLLIALWQRRRFMALAMLGVIALFFAATLFFYLATPRDRIATLNFRLTFDGADQNTYPNGTPFSSSEMVASPVLTEVYRANELERYLTFDALKESMYVLPANPDVELLSYEYQAKLADARLTPVDRARLEAEFRTKRDSLRSAQYSLNFQRSERSVTMPDAVVEKVLHDALATWAQQASERKGAARYDIAIMANTGITEEFLATEDYVIAVDVLRAKADRLLRTITIIERLPGASAVRIRDQSVSLADVRASLEDLVRFKIEPLFGRVRATGLSRDPAGTQRYFQSRLLHARMQHAQAEQRIKALQDALQGYLQRGGPPPHVETTPGAAAETVSPQLGDSFIDRLIEMSRGSDDLAYRQRITDQVITEGLALADLNAQVQYYETMTNSFAATGTRSATPLGTEVTAVIAQTFKSLTVSMEEVAELYETLAEQNLNASGHLYRIGGPVLSRATTTVSLRGVLLYFVITVLLAMIVIPIAMLGHFYLRHVLFAPARPPAAAAPPRPTAGL